MLLCVASLGRPLCCWSLSRRDSTPSEARPGHLGRTGQVCIQTATRAGLCMERGARGTPTCVRGGAVTGGPPAAAGADFGRCPNQARATGAGRLPPAVSAVLSRTAVLRAIAMPPPAREDEGCEYGRGRLWLQACGRAQRDATQAAAAKCSPPGCLDTTAYHRQHVPVPASNPPLARMPIHTAGSLRTSTHCTPTNAAHSTGQPSSCAVCTS